MALANDPREWVTFNHDAQTYETPDGTSVPAELVDNANCFADILHIAIVRASQRDSQRTE